MYHGCSFQAAISILAEDTLRDFTRHVPRPGAAGAVGVSLSRDIRVARGFGPVVLELDQRLLTMTHRITATDYWGHSPETKMLNSRRKNSYAEAEEFVVGPIRKVGRFIRAIRVDAVALARLRQRAHEDWLNGEAAILLQNPLLRLDGKPALPAATGTPPTA